MDTKLASNSEIPLPLLPKFWGQSYEPPPDPLSFSLFHFCSAVDLTQVFEMLGKCPVHTLPLSYTLVPFAFWS